MAYCLLQPAAVATAGFSGSGGGARWNQKEIYFSFCWVKRKCQVVVCRAWLGNARNFAPTSALLQGTQATPPRFSPASSFFLASLCPMALPPPSAPHLPPPDHGLSLQLTQSKIRWVLVERRISEISFQSPRAHPPPRPGRGNMLTLLVHHFLSDKSVRPLTNTPPPHHHPK